MKRRRIDFSSGYTMGIFVLFLAGFLALVLFGARAYGSVAGGQNESNNRRALLSYVSFSVRNHDHEGAVSVADGPEGDMLVLTGVYGERAYETRIYLSGGELIEEYGKAEDSLGSGAVQSIGACGSFSVEAVSGRCLRVTLDDASILLCVRSVGEGWV